VKHRLSDNAGGVNGVASTRWRRLWEERQCTRWRQDV